MNKHAILHTPDSGKFCFPVSINEVSLRLRVSCADIYESITVVYGVKYNFFEKQNREILKKRFCDGTYDYYTTNLELDDVRLVYVFEIVHNGKTYYFCEDGLKEKYDFSKAYFNSFQLPYINSADVHEEVQWMREAVFYQIFVDRFARGDATKCEKYIDQKWNDIPTPKTFAGGDIKGVIEKLDYIKNLGCNAIYLTPIFRSKSNHKYDISDYYNVDKHFGSNKDLKKLVETAHNKGMKIMLDAVFNHCSEDLNEWQDVVKNGKKSKYHDWFIIRGDKPTKNPLNYECFNSCTYMPKFNTSNKEVQRFLNDIASYYIKEYDIDGLRLDVSDEVSKDYWRNFRKIVKELKSDCVIIGENWHDSSPYLQGDQFDGIMNYAFTKICYDYFLDEKIDAVGLGHALSALLMRSSNQANRMMLNLLDSHDTHRFLTMVEGDKDKLATALALCYMYIGAPMIYYGTEIELNGGYDPDCRRTFDWNKLDEKIQTKEIISILSKLKERNELMNGEISFATDAELFVLNRISEKGHLRLLINNSSKNVGHELKGKLLCSHNYDGKSIHKTGFIIEEVK